MKNKRLQYRYSSAYLIRRFYAIVIDFILGCGLYSLLYFHIFAFCKPVHYFSILGIYFSFLICELLFSATPGMLLMKLRVKTIKSNRIYRLILRKFINLIEYVFCFPVFLFINALTPGKTSVSEKVSKCFVVYKHSFSKLGKNENASTFNSILTVVFFYIMLMVTFTLLYILFYLVLYVYAKLTGAM